MQVDIKQISRVIGASVEVDVRCNPEDIELEYSGFEFTKPVYFTGSATNISLGVIELEGKLTTQFVSHCDRCLDDVKSDIEEDVKVLFLSKYSSDRDLHEYDSEDYIFEGHCIVIDKALKDSIILSLPSKVLCDQDCRGICEYCNRNRNKEACECKENREENTGIFEKLKKLL